MRTRLLNTAAIRGTLTVAAGNLVRGNVAAGSDRVGFRVSGDVCTTGGAAGADTATMAAEDNTLEGAEEDPLGGTDPTTGGGRRYR
eukprot:576783-Prorocentrum_minimum.AAC.5